MEDTQNQVSHTATQAKNAKRSVLPTKATTGGIDPVYLNLLDDRIQRLTQAANVTLRRELSEASENRSTTLRSTNCTTSDQCPVQEAPINTK